MTEQTALNLISACFGFVAAIYFCIGSAFLSQKKIVAISITYWGANLEYAKASISQSAQYAVGGLLLLVSFVLQVAATQASTTNPININLVISTPVMFVFSTLFALGVLSYALYWSAIKYRQPRVLQELQKPSPQITSNHEST